MDIKQIINVSDPKSAAAAAAAATDDTAPDLHLLQLISRVNSFPLWETGSERDTSSPGSKLTRYPTPRLVGQRKGFNEAPNIRHPSPTAMQALDTLIDGSGAVKNSIIWKPDEDAGDAGD